MEILGVTDEGLLIGVPAVGLEELLDCLELLFALEMMGEAVFEEVEHE